MKADGGMGSVAATRLGSGKSKKANATAVGRPRGRLGSSNDILDVALDLFSRLGFDGVSTTAIARTVGVSQSVVLYHFDTKDAMWRASMERLASRVTIARLMDHATYKDLDILSRIRVALRRFVHISAEHPQLGRVLYNESICGGPRLDWLYEHVLQPSYSIYEQLFNEAISAGVLKDHNPRLLMILAHAGAATVFNLAPMTERLLERSPFDADLVDQQADLVVDALLNGLIVRNPEQEFSSTD